MFARLLVGGTITYLHSMRHKSTFHHARWKKAAGQLASLIPFQPSRLPGVGEQINGISLKQTYVVTDSFSLSETVHLHC